MDGLQLRELVAEALTDSVRDQRALSKLSNDHASLDGQYKQLVKAWFGIFQDLCGETYNGHPMNIDKEMRDKIAELQHELRTMETRCMENLAEREVEIERVKCLHSDAVTETQAVQESFERLQKAPSTKRCPECGAELVSSSTGCADEPDECLVCSLRDGIFKLQEKGTRNHSRVEILVRALQAAKIEPGGKCAEFKTDAGSILLGINSDGKTFDVEWTPDGVTPRFRG